jgi:type II secretory pathway pseudopilin PulG
MKMANGKWQMANRGFTLIETLIVMLILVTIGSIILSIFIIALTGTSKTRNQQIVRENGNSAIAQITRQLQYAKTFNYVRLDDGGEEKTDCLIGSPDEESIRYEAVSVSSFEDEETILACVDIPAGETSVATIASVSASVSSPLDASLVNIKKVKVVDCYFTCKQQSLSETPTFGVYLKLSSLINENNAVLFETTIVPRNF